MQTKLEVNNYFDLLLTRQLGNHLSLKEFYRISMEFILRLPSQV